MTRRKMMELNDLKIFIELYRNRSISKTAEKLNYTQSNISTRLMKLEQEFSTQLFIRTKTGLELSKDTERFYFHAKKIEHDLQDFYQEFSMPCSNEITIGSTQLLSRLFFPTLYQLNQKFSLHTTNSKKLCRDFNNHMYDLIFTHTKLESSNSTLCYLKSENLSWASSTNFTKPETDGIDIVINRDKACPLRNLSIEAIPSLTHTYHIVEVDTLDLMLSLLCTSSNCIALLPQKVIDSDNRLAISNFLPPSVLSVFLYCNSNVDINIVMRDIIHPFSFSKLK